MKIQTWALLSLLALTLRQSQVLAQSAPSLLPFQGRLTDQTGLSVSNGVQLVQFKLFGEPSSGTPVWAGELHRTTVNGGLVNVLLGSKTPFSGVDFDRQLYLEITVDINGDNAITPADPPLLPRQLILPPAFAKEAAHARDATDSRLLGGHDWSAVFGTNSPASGRMNPREVLAERVLASQSIVSAGDIVLGTARLNRLNDSTLQLLGSDFRIHQDLSVEREITAGGINVGGTILRPGSVEVGNSSFGGQSVELRIYNGQPPFLDFANDPLLDYDARLLLADNDTLLLTGADLKINENLLVDREINAGSLRSGRIDVGGGSFSGQSLELRISNGQPTFVDFSNDPTSDFDMRLILSNDDTLLIQGGNVAIEGNLQVGRLTQTGSDRNSKTNFASVDAMDLLDKVALLPVQKWRFTNEPSAVRHIGPTAQDFHAAFGCGENENSISTVDADGVALAAIQALYQMIKKKDDENQILRQALADLTRRVDAMTAARNRP